tara:strand:+ start:4185 stop:5351 length:1167 start_codon:yes stop_codon:yes gene_type:complete
MEVVFLIGAIQALFLSTLVFAKKGKIIADFVLFACLALAGFHLFTYYLYCLDILYEYPILNLLAVYLPMLQGPFTYVYVKTVTNKNGKFDKLNLLHSVPYLIVTAVLSIIVFSNDILPASDVIKGMYLSAPPFVEVTSIFNSIVGPIYIVLSWLLLKKHKNNILRDFSYTEEIDLKWLKYVILLMGSIWIVVVIVNILANFSEVITDKMGTDLIYYSVAVVIFIEGYFGIKQQVIYAPSSTIVPSDLPIKENVLDSQKYKKIESRYVKSGLKKEESEKYLQKLLEYMDRETPYMDGKLSLKQVAQKMDISTNYLSQVINENLNRNFFDFVNEYRVNLIKQKMEDPSNNQYTLLALAFDCGFNSKSSFNVIFKKSTGLTPSAYIKSNIY